MLTQSELARYEGAAENGVRLEMIAGQPFWEFQPNYDHQRRILRITKSVRPDPEADTGCQPTLARRILSLPRLSISKWE